MDPIDHYIRHGHAEGRDPTPHFSTRAYRARHADVAEAGVNPFYHFLEHGWRENRETAPLLTYCGVGPAEPSVDLRPSDPPGLILSAPTPGNEPTARDDKGARISDLLPDLDCVRAAQLLGAEVVAMAPRAWLVEITDVLSRHPAADGEAPAGTIDTSLTALPDGSELAARMVAQARGKTLSLDVWDTILRRDCCPDAIKLRHTRLQWLTQIDRAGPMGGLHPVDLLQLRRMAEADAADAAFEYRITDVAARLAPLFAPDDEDYPQQFLEEEMRIEQAAISLDPVVAELVARHRGRKIVLSDFYMPGAAVTALLDHIGIGGIDRVYVSCDHMATKREGTLYDVALAREGVTPGAVLHVGDRFAADVTMPRWRGIEAFHYVSPSQQPRLDRQDRDFWAYIAGDGAVHARAIAGQLGHAPGDPVPLEMLAVAVTAFVMHVIEEALRRKIDTVFFMTREGVFFKRIYDLLVARDVFDLGAYPASAVIEVSRRATFVASLEDFDVKSLMRLWRQYSTQSIRALATTLNVDVAKWAPAARKYGFDLDAPIRFPWSNQAFGKFLRHPDVLHAAREQIVQRRASLLEYLTAIGFDPRAEVDRLVVDIGWRGTIQDNLAAMVRGQIHGCYFGLDQFLNPQPANATKSACVFDANRGYPLRVPEVAGLEFLFNATGGSTTDYRGGKALREIIAEEEAIVAGPVAAMQNRLAAAAAKVGDYARRQGLISHDLVSFAREAVASFAFAPPPDVASAFFDLSHNESFGVGGVHAMGVDPRRIAALGKLCGARLHGETTRLLDGQRWPAALMQLPAFRTMAQRLSPTQRLHLPVAPAIVHAGSLGRARVAVLSPQPLRGSGGHRTIFNLAAALGRHGYDVHLMHERPGNAETDDWVSGVLGDAPVTQHNAWLNYMNPAASVATIWYSANYPLDFWTDRTTQFYFVQDYEAMFNPVGDTFIRANQSYSRGARHLCVGRWLAHCLRAQFGVGVASGGLGVDHQVYRPLDEVSRNPHQIALLFQPEKYRRAPKLCIAALHIVKARMPEARIVLYGSDARPHLPFDHEHLGLITDVRQINRLYNESAIGLCISLTNPSRIPFEMMVAGCVPVDLYRYNNLFDYDSGSGLLAQESPESVAEAMLSLLGNPAMRAARGRKSIASVAHRSLTWEMDVAVNAVDAGLDGFNFDTIEPIHPTYRDDPVIAPTCDTAPERHFLAHHWAAAAGGFRNWPFPARVRRCQADERSSADWAAWPRRWRWAPRPSRTHAAARRACGWATPLA